MKHTGLITLVWMVLAALCGSSFYVIAQNNDADKNYWEKIYHPNPPHYPKGTNPEIFPASFRTSDAERLSVMVSEQPDSIILYPDRLKIWTTDTTAVYNVLGNRYFVTDVYPVPNGELVVECSTGNALLGIKLRDSLRNLQNVRLVDNFGYSTETRSDRWPKGIISVSLYNEEDSIQLKEIVDSLGLKALSETTFYGTKRWYIKSGKTKESTIELARKLHNLRFFKTVSSGFGGRVILDFTYDSLVNEQWSIYDLTNVSYSKLKSNILENKRIRN